MPFTTALRLRDSPMANNPSKRFSQNGQFVVRAFPEDTVLVPIHQKAADMENVYVMNSVAAFIWNSLDGKHTVADISRALAQNFEVSHDEAESDVASFLENLRGDGLLREIAD